MIEYNYKSGTTYQFQAIEIPLPQSYRMNDVDEVIGKVFSGVDRGELQIYVDTTTRVFVNSGRPLFCLVIVLSEAAAITKKLKKVK